MDLNTKFKLVQIRNKLNLNVEPWTGVPDDLLYLALIPKGKVAQFNASNIWNTYKMNDNDLLEFIGDAVLDLVVAQTLSGYDINDYSSVLSHFVSNKTLTEFMERKYLCSSVFSVIDKACADRFEAIIGALYFHLYYIEKRDDAIFQIELWYLKLFDVVMSNSKAFTYNGNLNINLEDIQHSWDDLNQFPYKIPNDLLAIVFKQYKIVDNTGLTKSLINKYGFSSDKMFIFLGSKVMKMLVTNDIIDLIMDGTIRTAHEANTTRENLLSPNSIGTLTIINYGYNGISPYSILGSLYYYLYKLESHPNGLQMIDEWFVDNWLPVLTQPPLIHVPEVAFKGFTENSSLTVKSVRSNLGLNLEPWVRIPDNLIIISYDVRFQVKRDLFYFIGFRLFELIDANILAPYMKITSVERVSFIKPGIIYDTMIKRGLCTRETSQSECVTRFISIIGILFWYLDYVEHSYNSIELISGWVSDILNYQKLIFGYNSQPHPSCKGYEKHCNFPLKLKIVDLSIDINFRHDWFKIAQLRDDLSLPVELQDIPDELLALPLSMMGGNKKLSVNISNYTDLYNLKYGVNYMDMFMYIGIGVIKFIVSYGLYDLVLQRAMDNETANQLINDLTYYNNLAKLGTSIYKLKPYANGNKSFLTTVVGILYYYLSVLKQDQSAVFSVRQWLIRLYPHYLTVRV